MTIERGGPGARQCVVRFAERQDNVDVACLDVDEDNVEFESA
jgi:hypothetical protein